MFKNIEVFKISYALATHAAHRQTLVARNMANSDTPGYVARDIAPFSDFMAKGASAQQMRVTREGHFGFDSFERQRTEAVMSSPNSPNGNGVSIEEEMLKAVDIKRQHDRALAIYKSGLNQLRSTLGR